ncbi:MAG: type IV pilin N-terminal domain-containing protein [Euryarchaeota archaeon]|nr:type IV pilin N-terminal domain-containing protein [Euryarchaeota archaeon]MBU4453751.1 type IV pilin N-terminal domain-containing protein [Euryarchaeota archaeon]MCG2737968.1 type IV pilin N-terminal domain-containing protein [Candidatus Methanoperedenaceae archaeon]
MKIFNRNEEAVSPVIGVILMVAITVILAAVIAAFVFGLGGQQVAAPTVSITAANNPETSGVSDIKIQHKGGEMLKDKDWKISVILADGTQPTNFTTGQGELSVGSQIIVRGITASTAANITASNTSVNSSVQLSPGKYDIKLIHVPSNAMLLDQVVEVR